ncbi:MAG: hypothetical protein GX222_06665 [Ruminococcaceae bacterium]|nr:hypothetical protein [Oscillospiraceae bacterium]
MTILFDRILGAMAGCAIGDAMGSPTETRPTYLIKEHIGGGDYVRDYHTPLPDTLSAGSPKGLVTDDFSVSYLSLKQFAQQGGEITKEAAIAAMLEWSTYDRYYISHSGPTSKKSIAKLKGEPYDSKDDYTVTDIYASTNGAGMKAWCAGILNIGDLDKAIDDAIVMCKVTHDNAIALSAGCAVAAATAYAATKNSTIAGVVKAGLYGAREGYNKSLPITRGSVGASVEERIKLAVSIGLNYSNDFDRLLLEMSDIVGTGLNANEAIPAAFGFLVAAQGKVMDSIIMSINVGADTDTVAAIAGAMCGAYSGAEGLDSHIEFISEVNDFEIVELARTLESVLSAK